ncbi:MAG: hypothetical protein AVDCRST_MAG49-4573 [uncultured Thermomicrobiales bacterium]|uniref:Uncharacterized protein n=1 Tax=uncultured Thermomicrobiales bacterium TaxID=1645740 RepID=A0A6J4VP08_9BACT|nr:MAG: hypothetical protein AVDCRST_MAG49-4573 [uncultured Thermomicrobiales bacterium]
MAETWTYYDLRDAFAEEGCPVCRLTLASVDRYFDGLNYEAAGDPGVRAKLRDSLGFCNEHAYRWLHVANVLATAQIYRDILSHLVAEIGDLRAPRRGLFTGVAARLPLAGPEGRDSGGAAMLAPSERCPACVVLDRTETMAVETLVRAIPEPGFAAAYRASAGLCLSHLRLALATARDQAAFDVLRDAAVGGWKAILDHLDEIIRRHDYRYTGEPAGDERGAAERALRQTVGTRGIRGRQGPP